MRESRLTGSLRVALSRIDHNLAGIEVTPRELSGATSCGGSALPSSPRQPTARPSQEPPTRDLLQESLRVSLRNSPIRSSLRDSLACSLLNSPRPRDKPGDEPTRPSQDSPTRDSPRGS